jgi:tetratricopeptide (TPR) repeat protein
MRVSFLCLLAVFPILLFSCGEEVKTSEKKLSAADVEAALIKDINQYPDSLQLQEILANFYQENGEFEKAIQVMTARARTDSNNDKLQEALGFLHYENDDTAQAIIYYQKAYRIVADKSYLIAMATLEAGRKNPIALRLADEIIRIDGTGSADKAYFVKGIFYNRSGDNTLALQNFDEAIKAGYSFTPPYLEKAQLLMQEKKYAEAIITLDKAIAVQNNFPEAYYYKAICFYNLGDKQASLKAFDMALLYDPNYTDAQDEKLKYFGKQ